MGLCNLLINTDIVIFGSKLTEKIGGDHLNIEFTEDLGGRAWPTRGAWPKVNILSSSSLLVSMGLRLVRRTNRTREQTETVRGEMY